MPVEGVALGEGARPGVGLDGLGLLGTLLLPVVSGCGMVVWAWAAPPRLIIAVAARANMEVRMVFSSSEAA
jgi:hypothetical protein